MRTKKVLTGAGLAVVVAASLTAAAWATPAAHVQKVTISIVRPGANADERSVNPNIAVAPEVPLQIAVVNHTREFHTFTIPGLNMSVLVRPAHGSRPTTTTFTFTIHRGGTFAWYCAVCRYGGHGAAHEMGGRMYAIVPPSLLP